jgi:hypothetical protein
VSRHIVLAATALLLACETPNASGPRDGGLPQPSRSPDGAERADLAPARTPDTQSDPAPPAPDAAGSGDSAREPDALPPDVAAADLPLPDAAPDAAASVPAEPCEGPARGCSADDASTFRCEAGRWIFDKTCTDGTSCSAGDCVCRPGLCEEGVLFRSAASIYDLAIGGDLLHFQKTLPDLALSGLQQLNLRTNELITTLPEQTTFEIRTLAADPKGGLGWCREQAGVAAGAAIMRGTEVLEPVSCQNLALDDTHVYYDRQDRAGVFRRALDRPGQQTVTDRDPRAFALVGRDLYFSTVDDRNEQTTTTSLHRVAIGGAQPAPARRLAVAVTPDDASFYRIAVDDRYLYGVNGDSLMWAPQPTGASPSTFTRFWDGTGPMVMGLTVSDTHVYWATWAGGLISCTSGTIWRKAKLSAARAVAMATYPGGCPAYKLILHQNHLYTVISSELGGSQIVRLRL